MDYPKVRIRRDLINEILLYFAKLSRLLYILCLPDKSCAQKCLPRKCSCTERKSLVLCRYVKLVMCGISHKASVTLPVVVEEKARGGG